MTDTSPEDELSHLQRTFRDRTAVVQALSRDLLARQRTIAPDALMSRRLEYVINILLPPEPSDDLVPTNPARLRFELGWLDVLEPMYRQGLREAIANPSPGLIIPPNGRKP